VYRLLGGGDLEEMETLRVYYQRHSAEEIRETINHLYGNTLAAWHNSESDMLQDVSPRSLYFKWLGLDNKETKTLLLNKVNKLCSHAQQFLRPKCTPKTLTLHLQAGDNPTFPNPIEVLFGRTLVIRNHVPSGVTHAGSILNRCWSTNRAGPG
ncbi:MAG: hypothetical protein GXP42_10480, partial [Chloroflexi bacterium]|nr:hypothetical protein [Chloroflexota bacterium]